MDHPERPSVTPLADLITGTLTPLLVTPILTANQKINKHPQFHPLGRSFDPTWCPSCPGRRWPRRRPPRRAWAPSPPGGRPSRRPSTSWPGSLAPRTSLSARCPKYYQDACSEPQSIPDAVRGLICDKDGFCVEASQCARPKVDPPLFFVVTCSMYRLFLFPVLRDCFATCQRALDGADATAQF